MRVANDAFLFKINQQSAGGVGHVSRGFHGQGPLHVALVAHIVLQGRCIFHCWCPIFDQIIIKMYLNMYIHSFQSIAVMHNDILHFAIVL